MPGETTDISVAPIGREQILDAGRRIVDLLAAHWNGPPEAPVYPGPDRAEVRKAFTNSIPEIGGGLSAVVDAFEESVLPIAMRTPHPRYWGLVNTSPLPGAVLADLLVSMLNNNGGAFEQGPAVWAAETEIIAQLARFIGRDDLTGLFVPGGSYANMHGLLLARAAKMPDWDAHGPAGVRSNPVLYTTTSAHFCTSRAAMAMGFGRDNVVNVPTTGRGCMDPGALDDLIRNDLANGRTPVAVSATFGTTGTGALDPLEEIAAVCRSRDVWMHVDACYGGGLVLLEEMGTVCRALRHADSIAIDPHKWFYMPMVAGIALTPHADLELETFGVNASYIPNDGHPEGFMRSILTSRRGAALMMWLGLKAHGWSEIRQHIRDNIALTRLLEKRLHERGFVVLPDGRTSIACARWIPADRTMSPVQLDDLQNRIARNVIDSGHAWFSTTLHDGLTWLRLNILNINTRLEDVEIVIEAVCRAARGCE